ncbi:hypothetical protein F5050DRAFT_1713985 [Lentinula boryana]|uniref:Uncharacterized protein n=1 Tax=Lentinula boryana TaxID=40481 RepID=A0ABQ8Q6D4_9AGAR|nr:hypothetical protein F5050DRAFT_1713985 [Lentinula boryana]
MAPRKRIEVDEELPDNSQFTQMRILPNRTARTQKAGLITAPTSSTRRTPAQKKTDDVEELAALHARIAEIEKSQQKVAELELEEEEEQAATAAARVDYLQDPSDEDVQFFQFEDNEDEDDEGDTAAKKKAAKQTLRKPAKGATRTLINEKREQMKVQLTSGGGKKKKAVKQAGIYSDWKHCGLGENKARQDEGESSSRSIVVGEGGTGGLQDDSVVDVRPDSVSTQMNDLVCFVSSKPVVTRTPQVRKQKKDQGVPVTAKTPMNKNAKAIKNEPTLLDLTPAPSSDTSTSSLGKTPTPTNLKALPDFMQADWATKALPQLYSTLFSSEKPFEHFSKSSDFIGILTELAKKIWPGNTFVTMKNSSYVEMAYNRCNEKRSRIGNECYKHVESFFATNTNFTSQQQIVNYCNWVLSGDGPLLFSEPTPEGIENGQPGWKKPRGCWLSPHIIAVIRPHVKLYVAHNQNAEVPKGLLALVAAGLEKSFTFFSVNGLSTKAEKQSWFTQSEVNSLVVEYMETAKSTQPTRWIQIVAACGANEVEPIEIIKPHSIHRRRAVAYDASSPPPPEHTEN